MAFPNHSILSTLKLHSPSLLFMIEQSNTYLIMPLIIYLNSCMMICSTFWIKAIVKWCAKSGPLNKSHQERQVWCSTDDCSRAGGLRSTSTKACLRCISANGKGGCYISESCQAEEKALKRIWGIAMIFHQTRGKYHTERINAGLEEAAPQIQLTWRFSWTWQIQGLELQDSVLWAFTSQHCCCATAWQLSIRETSIPNSKRRSGQGRALFDSARLW